MGKRIEPERAELNTLGLNHLSWHRGFTIDGEDVWPQVMTAYLAELDTQEHPEWDPRTVEVLGMIPNYYLQYFYYTDKKLAAQEKWPPSRAEEVMVVEEDPAAPVRRSEPEGASGRPDEARRRLLFHRRHPAAHCSLQRPG